MLQGLQDLLILRKLLFGIILDPSCCQDQFFILSHKGVQPGSDPLDPALHVGVEQCVLQGGLGSGHIVIDITDGGQIPVGSWDDVMAVCLLKDHICHCQFFFEGICEAVYDRVVRLGKLPQSFVLFLPHGQDGVRRRNPPFFLIFFPRLKMGFHRCVMFHARNRFLGF